MYINPKIYRVQQHTGPEVFVHESTGFSHCNADWEVRGGTVATPKQVPINDEKGCAQKR